MRGYQHWIGWHPNAGPYTDHGAIFYENSECPLHVNSIAVDHDGTVYSLRRINRVASAYQLVSGAGAQMADYRPYGSSAR